MYMKTTVIDAFLRETCDRSKSHTNTNYVSKGTACLKAYS